MYRQGQPLFLAAVAAFGIGLVLAATGEARVSVWFVAASLIAAAVVWLEGGPDSAKEIAVVATLAGAAAAGRVLFAAVPGVQPVTVMTIVAGAALGLRAGVAVGMLAAFVSNFFLAQGPWTPYQMLAWGACGAIGALLAPLLRQSPHARRRRVRARIRVQHVHGRLGVVRLLAARRGARSCSSSAAGSRSASRTRSATSCSRWPRGRSCAACSSGTAAACMPRWCGREAARVTRGGRRHWRRPRRHTPLAAAGGRGVGLAAADGLVCAGLRAAGADTGGALDYLVAHEGELSKPTELSLVALPRPCWDTIRPHCYSGCRPSRRGQRRGLGDLRPAAEQPARAEGARRPT